MSRDPNHHDSIASTMQISPTGMADAKGTSRVLVIEDDPHIRKLLGHLLGPRYDLELAATSEEALALARAQPFDLFLIDINLGETRTGLDVLSALRQMPVYETTPAIACTAYALHGDREQFLAYGFDAYIDKPFVPAVLRETVCEVLHGVSHRRADAPRPPAPRAGMVVRPSDARAST